MTEKKVTLLPITQLAPNPWNRQSFSEKSMRELASSVRHMGIMEPLIVRPKAEGYEIASGNRRWLAARDVGLKEVPCLVQALSDDDVKDMNLVNNVQREDLPVLERARMIKERMSSACLTQEQMAQKIGKERSWVAKMLGVADLHPDALAALAKVPMAFRPLVALRALGPELQIQLAQALRDGHLKPEALERKVMELSGRAPTAASSDDSDPLAAFWKQASAKAGKKAAWDVQYEGSKRWRFGIQAVKGRAELRQWFLSMAFLLGEDE